MGEKEDIYSNAKIEWVGIIDLGVFYQKLQEWLKVKKYSTSEKRYVEKIKPNGKQMEIVWNCTKGEGPDDWKYFKFEININFLLIGVTDAEIEKNGKRLKLNKIDATITLSSTMEKDAENKWKDKPFWKSIYETYIIGQQIEDAKIQCYKDTTALIEEIKRYFDLYSLK